METAVAFNQSEEVNFWQALSPIPSTFLFLVGDSHWPNGKPKGKGLTLAKAVVCSGQPSQAKNNRQSDTRIWDIRGTYKTFSLEALPHLCIFLDIALMIMLKFLHVTM